MAKGKYILGKVDYNGSGKKDCEAVLAWELSGDRFSMCGEIWNPRKTDIYCGGQCVDKVVKFFPDNAKAQRMLAIWRRWHLNDMKAGSPAQIAAIRQHEKDNPQWRYDYTAACEILEGLGLNPDPSYIHDGKPYKYGSAWLKEELPADVIAEVIGWGEGDSAAPDAFTLFLESLCTMEAQYIGEEEKRGDRYLCIFTEKLPAGCEHKKPKKMRTDWYQGIGHRINNMGKAWNERESRAGHGMRFQANHKKSAPAIKTVIDCLIRDAQAYMDNQDFLDFIDSFGYEDKKEGRRIWQECEKQYSDLQAFFGKHFHALVNSEAMPETAGAL